MSNRTATARQFLPQELDQQFADWRSRAKWSELDEFVRRRISAELRLMRSMNVRECTLWKKWKQVQELFPVETTTRMEMLHRVRDSIWMPKDADDFRKLEPELVFVKSEVPITSIDISGNKTIEGYANPDPLAEDWRVLRTFVSSAEYSRPVGRALNYLVRDSVTGLYLGVICISGDFMDLAPREEAIGWDQESRVNAGRLNNLANASTIVPTQPFGFCVGGKLCALLCLSSEIAKRWEQTYGDVLVAVTTTSLYSQVKTLSQYSNLKCWKELGPTKGSVPLQLSAKNENLMKLWMRGRYPRKYWDYFAAQDRRGMPLRRDAVNRAYQFCYRKLGFKTEDFTSEHQRGVYLARLYKNADDFLCRKIGPETLVPAFDNSTAQLVERWKTKYANRRVESLVRDGRFSCDTLFYDDMIGARWEDVRAKYLNQVGR